MKKLISLGLALSLFTSSALAQSINGGGGGGGTTITGGQLPATATNDNAAAGKLGEFISSTLSVASEVALVNSTSKTVTSISLTAGDWEVSTTICFDAATTTNLTAIQSSISLTADTRDTSPGNVVGFASGGTVTSGNIFCQAVGPVRKSLAATTTVYSVALAIFSVSTVAVYGYLQAVRAR